MKLRNKKILAFLMAAVMAVAMLAGCSSSSSTGTSTPADPATPADSNTSGSEPAEFTYPMSGRELTYWTALNENVASTYTELGETPFGQGLQERTGVNITFLHPPTGGSDEQFSLIIADGDYPDLMEYHWQSYSGGPEKAIADGVIIELTDIIDQYCPNLKAYLESRPDVDLQCKTDEGHYYAFPFVRGDPELQVTMGLFIRQDWLDDLDLEIPTTIDEWHDVLTAFKEEKGATAPFSYEFSMGSLTDNMPFAYAYDTCRTFYVGDDGKVHYGAVEEGYRKYLETMHQWYEEGLIDPDIATASFDQVSAKMAGGQAGASFGWAGSRMGVWTNAGIENDPNYDLQPCPYPGAEAGTTAKMGQMDNICPNQGMVAITTSCKDVEAAARFLDWAYSEEGHMYYNFGTEGVSYTMENGSPVYTDLLMNNPDGLATGTVMTFYLRGNYNGPFVQDLRYLQQYYTLDGQKKSNATWTVPTADKYKLPPITPTSEESDEFSMIMNEVNNYRDEMTLKYILGTESLDSFDDFVATMEKMGLDRAIDIQNAALDRYNAR
ncbi:MAG: extracellular solute-binding protein [Subdoligranulum sp.]|nr:extracellular solute-binding protein [Subdoligranulum sp.]